MSLKHLSDLDALRRMKFIAPPFVSSSGCYCLGFLGQAPARLDVPSTLEPVNEYSPAKLLTDFTEYDLVRLGALPQIS